MRQFTLLLSLSLPTVGLCATFSPASSAANEPARQYRDETGKPAAVDIQLSPVDDDAVERALEKCTTVSMSDRPLAEIVDFLQERTGTPILIDRFELDCQGMDDAATVSAEFSDMSLRSILNHLLRTLELTWTIRDGAVVITTFPRAERQLATQVYPVKDLLLPANDIWPEAEDADSLTEAIGSTVAWESWDRAGGPGAIRVFRGTLVVTQTRPILREIERWLATLRAARQMAEADVERAPARVSLRAYAGDYTAIDAALEKPATVSAQDTPLTELAMKLQESYNVPVVLDRRALDDLGFAADDPVTMTASGLRLWQFLDHVLNAAGLAWTVRDEAIVITTREAAAQREIRAYPVADLIGPPPPVDEFGEPRYPSSPDTVADVLFSTIATGSWKEFGGAGSLVSVNRIPVLMISQTMHVHRQIEALFAKLRAKLEARESAAETAVGGKGKNASPDPFAVPFEPAAQPGTSERLRVVVYFLPSPPKQRPTAPAGPPPVNPTGPGGAAAPSTANQVFCRGGFGNAHGELEPIPEESLLVLITQLIEPESWSKRQGVYARAVPSRLLICHDAAVHRRIHRLLTRLGVSFYSSVTRLATPDGHVGFGGGMSSGQATSAGGGGFFAIPAGQ